MDSVCWPLMVVVKTCDAVVVAVHPDHVVQGALLLHAPVVQPVHVAGGQPPRALFEPPHQPVLFLGQKCQRAKHC